MNDQAPVRQDPTRPARRGAVTLDAQRRGALFLCIGVPCAVLVMSYIWLAIERGSPWLWNTPVHESGRYTLAQTIFYFSHFLREIPTDIAYALFILAAAAAVVDRRGGEADGAGGVVGPNRRDARPARLAWLALGAAALLVAVALLLTVRNDGWRSALYDLAQMRTRDDMAAYGSHWRFHWLSTIWFGVAALLATPFITPDRHDRVRLGNRERNMTFAAWGYFAALTVVFGVSADTFLDVRYTGHQAREILTHGLITGPFALGVVQLLAVRLYGEGHAGTRGVLHGGADRRRWIAGALFLIIPLFLAVQTLAGDPLEAGQSGEGIEAMVAGHVFEHMLDYVLVTLLVTGGFAALAARQAAGTDRRS